MKTILKILLSILITYLLIAFAAWDISIIKEIGEIYWFFRACLLIGFAALSLSVYMFINYIEEVI